MEFEIGISQISMAGIDEMTQEKLVNFYRHAERKKNSAIPSILEIMNQTTESVENISIFETFSNLITCESIQGVLYGIGLSDNNVKDRVRERLVDLNYYINEWKIQEVVLGALAFREDLEMWNWIVREFLDFFWNTETKVSIEMICTKGQACKGENDNLIGGISFENTKFLVFDFANSQDCSKHDYSNICATKEISSIHLSGRGHGVLTKDDLIILNKILPLESLRKKSVYWEFLGIENWGELEEVISNSNMQIKNLI